MNMGESKTVDEMRDYVRQCVEGAFDASEIDDACIDCGDTDTTSQFAIVRPSTGEVFLITVQDAELRASEPSPVENQRSDP